MPTKQQRREIYWAVYCCLDGKKCELTSSGLCRLIRDITQSSAVYYHMDNVFPELWKQKPKGRSWWWATPGSPGWPERKEILRKAMELTYKK